MDKLAVYGTLRKGSKQTYRVKDVSLVFPGHKNFPAIIKNKEGKGAVVELLGVDDADLISYDNYEGVSSGLYTREKINVEGALTTKAWIYIAGPLLMSYKSVFEEVPEQDWLSQKTQKLLNSI
tara:strand:+ start:11525 stop:11893 length:369 start_codon:yes stop_codon:yes gene_type:complete